MGRMEVWFLLLVFCSATEMLVRVRGQDQNTGFISIDCGAPNDYDDSYLGTTYKTDDGFIDSGMNMQISTQFIYQNIWQQAKNLRVFPNGTRNCYTLQPAKGKENTYLVRASFYYGNYDSKNQNPVFDLHIGTDYWTTVNSSSIYYELIHVPRTDDIQVCLVNTGNGAPFISTLELRLVDSSIYQTDSGSLSTNWRYDMGRLDTGSYRYPQDVYDRIWSGITYDGWVNLSTTATTSLSSNNDAYKVPEEVLRTAQRTTDINSSIYLVWNSTVTNKWCIYFHFAELQSLPSGQNREFTVSVNGKLTETVALEYLKPVTVVSALVSGPQLNFAIKATENSGQYPPILNAVEFFTIIENLNVPTSLDDITTLNDVKKAYGIRKDSWQGDPCSPKDFIWDGLECTNDNPPRITSLNLSSSGLSGDVAVSFSSLLALVSLDLSGNQLTGQIPESLAQLPNLKTLNLSGNNLTGSIPESLQKKIDDQSLVLSATNNPNLCMQNSCTPKKKRNSFIIPVIAAVAGSVALLSIVLAIIWRVKSRKGKDSGISKGAIKLKNRPFTYNEVLKITENFKTVIGEGGFGKVYLGTLANSTKVAVKMLSRTSRQGSKEFQAEAQLLMIVHHRNLVSLVGYCDDAENMVLIYEFMENGNLWEHLSDESMSTHVLTWNERLRIAIDAAQGLDYLHNGCKPPIIHRDLKTPNILLNENMQAKIADFGLSKAFAAEDDSYISTRPAGTPGYLDPEFQSSGNLNRKSDVYSFGIILFELITGYHAVIRSATGNMHILQWVRPIIERGDIQSIVDPRLDGKFSVNSAWKLVEIAMSCVPATAIQRPDISQVLAELKECWAAETVSERSQRSGGTRKRSTGSFEMTSVELDYDSGPVAR